MSYNRVYDVIGDENSMTAKVPLQLGKQANDKGGFNNVINGKNYLALIDLSFETQELLTKFWTMKIMLKYAYSLVIAGTI